MLCPFPTVCRGLFRYADRAKAIPVNAVKNDESEQVEKLNNEIAALRKKLEEQVCKAPTREEGGVLE